MIGKKALAAATAAASFAAALNGVAPAGANGATFDCDSGFYQVIAGQLAEFQPGTDLYTKIGPDHENYNAMGYRLADGYLYAVRGKTLQRIDGAGNRYELGTLNMPSGVYTGDFGDDGLLHISQGGKNWHKVNVDTLEATPVPELSANVKVADVANVHGQFFGVSSQGVLYRFDPDQLLVTAMGSVIGLPESKKAYGAAWTTAGGNLYIGRNSGEIYQITGFTTTTPIATQLSMAPSTNSNDGASCPVAPVPAGLNDVDGPAPELPPKTPEAIAAVATYTEVFADLSATFEPPVSIPEQLTSEQSEFVVDVDEQTAITVDDAGIGQGASCEAYPEEDQAERFSVTARPQVDTYTELYNTGFDGDELSRDFQVLSGNWMMEGGALHQLNTCGSDYTSLLKDFVVDNFMVDLTYRGISGVNHGGVLINQSDPSTRSGAMLIDLFDEGNELRWGYYDDLGYYRYMGSVDVPEQATGQTVTLRVKVEGDAITVYYNGEWMEEATAPHVGGYVGIVATRTDIAFENMTLTQIPPKSS